MLTSVDSSQSILIGIMITATVFTIMIPFVKTMLTRMIDNAFIDNVGNNAISQYYHDMEYFKTNVDSMSEHYYKNMDYDTLRFNELNDLLSFANSKNMIPSYSNMKNIINDVTNTMRTHIKPNQSIKLIM